jgi:hypothetical protein
MSNKILRKFNDIPELTEFKFLDQFDFANLFYIVEKNEKSYYNINRTIQILNTEYISPSFYSLYEASDVDTWASISFIFYKTIKLWWVICKFNNVKNPFTELQARNFCKGS